MSQVRIGAFMTAAVAGVALAAPAAAAPTLSLDRSCYRPEQTVTATGTGYTPSGAITIFFSRLSAGGEFIGTLDAAADPAGAFTTSFKAPALKTGSARDDIGAAANDMVKVQAGGGPPDAVAFGIFQVTDLDVDVPHWAGKPPSRRKKVTVNATGFTLDIGKDLYAHYVRNGKAVKSVRVGRLAGDCGDLKAQIKQFPAGLKAGRYTVTFNAARAYARNDFSVRFAVTMLKPLRGSAGRR